MESLLFLNEKGDGTTKARGCANGSTQRGCIPKEEASSPIVSTDSVLIAGVIEEKQGRDVMMIDMPNAFAQTVLPEDDEKVIMKIRGRLVDTLAAIDPDKHSPYAHEIRKSRLLCVRTKTHFIVS